MKTVFYGGAALLLIGLALLIPAIQLVPTDLGNTYLLGSIILMASGVIIWAIGKAGGSILHEIKAMQASAPVRAPMVEPVVTLPAIPLSPPSAEPKPAAMPGAVLTAGAGAAAGVVAGALIGGATRAESAPPVEERLLDDLERDLFADIAKSEAKPASPDEPAPPAADDAEDSAFLQPAGEPPADTGEHDVAEPESETADEDAPSLAIDNEPAPEGSMPAEPVVEDEAEEPEAPAPAPMPGLIADADLAALEDAEPDLAPLDTLEIVGAYDSGGTRFTMYSDGSVTALGEGVDRRFRSLDDLRAFIDGGMKG